MEQTIESNVGGDANGRENISEDELNKNLRSDNRILTENCILVKENLTGGKALKTEHLQTNNPQLFK